MKEIHYLEIGSFFEIETIVITTGVIEAEADHLDAVITAADHVLTMKIDLTGGTMEEEIEEIVVVVTVIIADPDHQSVAASVTITWVEVLATATIIEEVEVEEQMPP